MTYACSYDVPAPVEMYWEVSRHLGPELPTGLVSHVVFEVPGGLRHIEVWETEEAWTSFHEDRVHPIVHDILRTAGFEELPPDPPVEQLALVDVQVGPAGHAVQV